MSGPAIGGWAVEALPIPAAPATQLIGDLQALIRQYKRRPSVSSGDSLEKEREVAILDRALVRLVALESSKPSPQAAANDGGQVKSLQEELQRLKESNEKLKKELFQQKDQPAHAEVSELMEAGDLDPQQAALLGHALAASSEVFGIRPHLIAKSFVGNSQIGPAQLKARLVAGMILVEAAKDEAAPLLAGMGFKAPMNWLGFKSRYKDFLALPQFTWAFGEAKGLFNKSRKAAKEGVQA
jgi:hypothetical protein